MYVFKHGNWLKEKDYPKNPYPLLQLSCSHDEKFVIGTFKSGFQLWNIQTINDIDDTSENIDGCTTLILPNGVRNVSRTMNKSSPVVLSANQKFAIAGIRKELLVWSVESGELVKTLDAHFSRIIDVQPLTYGEFPA